MPGRSRGFGFVLFENKEDATVAVEKTNEVDYMGRQLRVNFAAVKPQRPRSYSGGDGGFQGGRPGGDRF